MNLKRNIYLLTLGTILVVSGGVSSLSRSHAAGPSHSANGQGTFLSDDGSRRSFSFSARLNGDGTASGHAVIHSNAYTYGKGRQPYMLNVDISCMKVIGNIAYFGGMPTKTNETDPVYQDAVYFMVQDNGEPGKNKDKASLAYFFDFNDEITGDPQLCQGLPDTSPGGLDNSALETIDQGNIQVR